MVKNPYRVLGLPDNCTDMEMVKKHYRKLSKQYHPDRLGTSADASEVQRYTNICCKLNEAYKMIQDGFKVASTVSRLSVGFTHVDIMNFKLI